MGGAGCRYAISGIVEPPAQAGHRRPVLRLSFVCQTCMPSEHRVCTASCAAGLCWASSLCRSSWAAPLRTAECSCCWMACRVGGLPPLPPWLSPLALISRDQPPQQPMRMPGLPACSAPRLSALPINTRTRTPPPPPLPSCTRIRTLCPLASPPTADYLPSPLDVNNFALDLDKGEERVLLPCSK